MKFLLHILLLLACSATYVTALEADTTRGAGALFFTSKDNENFYTQRLAVEYLPTYSHADALSGVRYTDHHYEQNSWVRNGKQLSFLHKKVDPATANGLQLEAGVFTQGQHDLITADANYRTLLSERTGLELFANRDWVETPAALDKGVNFTLGGAAIDHVLTPKVTLVGLAGLQSFSDNNSRNHGRVKLIYQPDPDLGLTLQARYRAYTSSSSNVGGAYFNPNQYDETMLAIGWRHRISGWMASLTAGAGQQKVASDPVSPTKLLELGLQSPASKKTYSLRLRAAMSQNAAFNGPDYRYNYIHGEWILAL